MEKHSSGSVIDTVQETWRKFRDGHMDLKQYITPEQKNASQVLKQACGISNLISEADLLLNDCQPLICVRVFSSFGLDIEMPFPFDAMNVLFMMVSPYFCRIILKRQ